MCLNNNPDQKVAYSPFKFQDPDELQAIKSGINKHVSPLVNDYRKIEETKVDVSAKRKLTLEFQHDNLSNISLNGLCHVCQYKQGAIQRYTHFK